MCTYNGEKFIKEQIDSILYQTLKVNEIIICDDGSVDNTTGILENYSYENPDLFKIYHNEINLRSVKNFEKAISLCSGDFIFLSDQDDIWVENKVEKMLAYFNQNPKINALATNGFCINDKSKILEKYSIWDVPEFLRTHKLEVDYFKLISYVGNIATGASMAIKKSIIKDILPFPIVEGFHHDEWIAIITANTKSFELLNEKYFYYRVHALQQVGGVFYDRNKFNLLLFDLNIKNLNFKILKKRIKKTINFIKLNELIKTIDHKNVLDYKKNIETSQLYLIDSKKQLKTKYPIKKIILDIIDKIQNKRQLNY